MLIYILLIILSLTGFVCFYKKDSRKIKLFFLLFAIIITIISAIRYRVGTDYEITYERYFYWLAAGDYFHYEPLFLLLNRTIIFFDLSPQILFVIASFFTIPAFYIFITKNVEKKYWFLSSFLLIVSTIYFASMNAVRQYMAIAVLLYGYQFLKNKKYIRYFLLICVAMMFHTSAIFSILIPIGGLLFKNDKMKKVFILFYFISIFLIFFNVSNFVNMLGPILPDRYDYYINSVFLTKKNYFAIIKAILPNILLIISYFNYNKLLKKCNHFNFIFSAWFMFVILSNAFYGINIFIRIGWYFDYFILLIIPLLLEIYNEKYISIFSKKINIKLLLFAVIMINYSSLTMYSIFLKNGHSVVPYHTFLMR